jgi:hypothetical protein
MATKMSKTRNISEKVKNRRPSRTLAAKLKRRASTRSVSQKRSAKGVTLSILNPIGMVETQLMEPAPRLTDLNGKRIGLFWNTKMRGDLALRKVEELLKQRFSDLEFTWFESKTYAEGLRPEEVEKIKGLRNQAMVGTSGD